MSCIAHKIEAQNEVLRSIEVVIISRRNNTDQMKTVCM